MQTFTNSNLVTYTLYSPNCNSPRNKDIDRITPHMVQGQLTVESLGAIFVKPERGASSNYGIGRDGRVALYVNERDRSWCSSSSANDNRAITIECASDREAPYKFNDVVYDRLIELCADICRRYGKSKLVWIDNQSVRLSYSPKKEEMVLTRHCDFANTSCPGTWMKERMGDLAKKVTNALNPEKVIYRVQIGAYKDKSNADRMLQRVKLAGFTDAYVKYQDNWYKVQVGAYSIYANAERKLAEVKEAGFKSAYINKST